jgi:hypothetical protein
MTTLIYDLNTKMNATMKYLRIDDLEVLPSRVQLFDGPKLSSTVSIFEDE